MNSLRKATMLTALLSMMATAPSTFAVSYDDETIEGDWSVSFEVTATSLGLLALAGVPPGAPFYLAGIASFDGQGGCDAKWQVVFDGLHVPGPTSADFWASTGGACTYAVAVDGTATMSVTFPAIASPIGPLPASTSEITMVLSDRSHMKTLCANQTIGYQALGTMVRQK